VVNVPFSAYDWVMTIEEANSYAASINASTRIIGVAEGRMHLGRLDPFSNTITIDDVIGLNSVFDVGSAVLYFISKVNEDQGYSDLESLRRAKWSNDVRRAFVG
jgi:hypothetical protein